MLTIAYMTHRKEPLIGWFFDSLDNELGGQYEGVKVVVVDFYAQPCDGWTEEDVEKRKAKFVELSKTDVLHVPPKPSVWQGPHRLTKVNYFAASSARNTAICLAEDGYVVFMDDLSVIMPGWKNGS